jgi:photosystem II oxygen-evolving enhancer protein 3
MFQDASERHGKVLVGLSFLVGLGLGALLCLPSSTPHEEDAAMTMASPYAMASRPMQTGYAFNPMQARMRGSQRVAAEPEAMESRRDLLSGLALAFAAAGAMQDNAAYALSPVDLKDDRKAKSTGFDLIYEARDLDLPQNIREGFTQARSSIEDTKKRAAESGKRIESETIAAVKKAYWTEAKESLRRQVGTLRFDLATLAGNDKAKIKANKAFFVSVEKFDFAIREKKQAAALKAYDDVKAGLKTVLG